ncbi:MAG: amino acid adenylation domain-containing protein [Thermoplasmata archaeon]|nr:amino acid adenylation domain-containing protein [Thermoplasmata archaeon]
MPQGDGRRGYGVVQYQRPSQAVSSLVERHEVMDMFRLSKVQYGIYAECIQNPDSTRYNIPAIERMPDHMDVDRLVRAVDALVEAHPGLRTRVFADDSGQPVQELDCEVHAIVKDMSDEEFDSVKDDLVVPFDLAKGPLARFEIYRTPSGNYLFMDIHHLIYDGSANKVLARDLGDAYKGKPLEKEKFTMQDEVAYEDSKTEEEKAEAKKFYASFLDGIETDSLPPRDVYSDTPAQGRIVQPFHIDEERFRSLRKEVGTNRTAFFIAVMGVLTARMAGKDNSFITSVHNGRRPENEDTINMFVRTIPVYTDISKGSIRDIISTTYQRLEGTYRNDSMSYIELAQEFGLNADITMAYQKDVSKLKFAEGYDGDVQRIYDKKYVSGAAMTFEVVDADSKTGDYVIDLSYRADMYTEGMMKALLRAYIKLAQELLAKECLDEIDLMDDESAEIIDGFNQTDVDQDLTVTPYDMIRKWMKETPDSVASVFKEEQITYGQMDSVTSAIAACIHSKGIGREDFVSILIPRGQLMVTASIGVLRAGAAYQPLDPSYPKERLNFMLKDSGAKLLIADRSLRDILDEYNGDVLFTDEIPSLKPSDEEYEHKPQDPFTILYTSGTTGTPKGCILENRNLTSFLNHHQRHFQIDENSRAITYASYGFDASMMDIFTTLCFGAHLYIIPEEMRLDIMAMDRYFTENQITHAFMTTQVGRQFVTMTECKTLKHFSLGGEKLVPVNPPEWLDFVNLYGPTETTVYVTYQQVKDDNPLCPIGRPNDNIKAYIMDKNGRQLPVGIPGELVVAGPQVTRGYLNRPDKTSEVFIVNPFCSEQKYRRAYRTGDIVRWLPDGAIEYIGRNDGQVKVRGFRIELTEVEKVIREFPGIKDATVAAFDAPSGGKFIAAYVVSDSKIDVNELNSFIAERKPPYMVPAVTMQIDAIPLNVNSKVDKRKLPKPEIQAEDLTPPENDVQQKIFDIVKGVIGTDAFGVDTDLYAAGLTSITTIQLNVLLFKEFGVDMQIKDLKENSTVRKLEKLIGSRSPSKTYEQKDSYALSKTQEGIFAECIANPGSTVYNIPLLFRISKDLDVGKLRESLVKAVNAHSFIRTRIFLDSSGDVQQSREDKEDYGVADIPVEKVDDLEKAKSNLCKPYNIIGDRLFRLRILETQSERYLYIDMHHIISDGTSMNNFLDSVSRAYAGEELEKEKFSGFEVVMSENEARTPEALDKAKTYYDNLLGGCETDILPRTDLYSKDKGLGSVVTDGASTEEIQKYCSEKGVTVNGMMCSVFGFVLSKFCGTEDPVFATVYNGRDDSRTAETVAMMVKTMPVVCHVKGKTQDYVRGISQQLMDSMSNSVMSFAEINKEFGVKSDMLFVYQGAMFGFETICGAPAEQIRLSSDLVKSPITFMLSEVKGKLHYECEYDKSLYSHGFVESLVDAFDTAVEGFLKRDELADVTVLSDRAAKVLEGFDQTGAEQDLEVPPYMMIEKWMKETPDSISIAYKDVRMTYKQLDEISRKICVLLESKGIGKEDFVSVLVPRSEWIALATVGIIRSGAAYQPLDPSYPKERLNFMVKDSGAKLVIVDRKLREIIDEYQGDVLFTDEIADLPDGTPKGTVCGPLDAFTILYTSGTTGTPKGCILENGNVKSIINHYTRNLEGSNKMRTASYASYGFDANMMDIFTSLCNGGELHIIPEDMRLDLPEVDRYFVDNGITHGFMTTQVGRQFVTMTKCKTLKHFLVGGEKLVPVNPVPWVDFVNIYGPTETSVYVTSHRVKDDNPLCPIGRPTDNTKAYVVDRNGHLLPVGSLGELYVAGPQVSRGYLNRPDKTSEVFIKNPFTNDPYYSRAYRTGDIVRWLTDGTIECIGRNDGQVKVRGFRVELTEVEKVIREFPGIRDATVAAFDSPAGGKYIAAYVVSDSKVDVEALNRFIGERKPPYMVPAATMQLDRIPLNVNSKVDKRKLPEPTLDSSRMEGRMPKSEAEKKLCEIFATVLGLEKVYADDDFFAIGGTSISASKLVLNCMNAGFPLVYKNIFDNPTPEQLARFITKQEPAAGGEEPKEEVVADEGPLSANVADRLDEISSHSPKKIMLTGCTGYLGSHVLYELLRRNVKEVFCLVRSGKGQTSDERLKSMFMYYFGGMFNESVLEKVKVLDCDITDKDLYDKVKDLDFDTIINCAAIVKHFAADDSIDRVNVGGVVNLIDVAKKKNAMLVQISTESVAGESVNGSVPIDKKMKENELFFGQNLENKYAHSKFMAEKAMIDAIPSGLRAKIIRVGNLMSRDSDGEFQINFDTNAFMKQMRSYVKLGFFSVTDMDIEVEFSPIDMVAKAVVILAGTPDQFTVFHVNNCHKVHMANVLKVMRDNDMPVEVVSKKVFDQRFMEALKDESKGEYVSGLISYLGNAGESRRFIAADETYSIKALYRLGFSWPIISEQYIDRAFKALKSMRFFK